MRALQVCHTTLIAIQLEESKTAKDSLQFADYAVPRAGPATTSGLSDVEAPWVDWQVFHEQCSAIARLHRNLASAPELLPWAGEGAGAFPLMESRTLRDSRAARRECLSREGAGSIHSLAYAK